MNDLYYNNNKIADDAIISFDKQYFFLSNYSMYTTPYNGLNFTNSEAAFHAQKSLDENERKKFELLKPNDSKRLGRSINLRDDWEEVKDNIMYEIVKSKFDNNSDIKKKLLDTGNRELYEGNTWNDKYWGVVKEGNNLIGKNTLGKILMKLREEYKK